MRRSGRSTCWSPRLESVGLLQDDGRAVPAREIDAISSGNRRGIDVQESGQPRAIDDGFALPGLEEQGGGTEQGVCFSNELSPTRTVSAKDDQGFFPGSQIHAKALEEVGASIRVHFFEKGGHGFSLRAKDHPLSTWPDLCLQWLRDKHVIEEETEQDKIWELAKNWCAAIRR